MTRNGKLIAWSAIAALALVEPPAAPHLPWFASHQEYLLSVFFLIFLYAAMAMGWNILGGFAGQVSFGHSAFLGIGAYATALLMLKGWPLWATIPVGGLLAALYSVVIGPPAFRLRGPYFAIATIGIGEATRLIALNWTSLTAGATGVTLPGAPPSSVVQYYVALALCATALGSGAWIRGSRFGYALEAIRSDPDAAETLGVDTTLAKTQALFISAAILGVSGCIFAMHNLFVNPDTFSFRNSISLVIMPIIGGVGTIAGPLLGAAIFTGLREQLEAYFANLDLLVFGALLCLIVLFEPRGLIGLFERLTRALPRVYRSLAAQRHRA